MSTTVSAQSPLGDLVTDDPSRTRVLQRFGLDFCCGGNRTLDQACTEAGLDTDVVLGELTEVPVTARPDWADLTPAKLTEHLVSTHHAFLWSELPRLQELVDKVARVHGQRHPELVRVREAYSELRADLEPHLMKEERVLFPAIAMLEQDEQTRFPFGSIANPIGAMLAEHDRAGELLAEIRALTDEYAVPADACGSYRAMLAGLREVEEDTHLHVHKENNVLFPRVLARSGS